MASDRRTGVVIRRGPAKAVCTLGWDRRKDTFSIGQWLRGRIYERRSDLSPDGKHMIYFAMNGRWHTKSGGAWTAVSLAPYLKAVALYTKGDRWNGGGLFTARDRYWLNGGSMLYVAHESKEVRLDRDFVPRGGVGHECLGVYFPRLLRDGWQLLKSEEGTPARATRPTNVHIFEKELGRGWWLRKLACASTKPGIGRACYWDEHELVHYRRGTVLSFPNWEWADLDGSRVVWAEAGVLRAAKLSVAGLGNPYTLIDLNPMTFEPIAAPY